MTKSNIIPLYKQPGPSLEAEQTVLGAILLKSSFALPPVSDLLTTDDFQNPGNREIYQAMLQLAERGEPVDLVSVGMLLHKTGKLEIAGGPGFLSGLTENVGTAANVQYYAQLVHDASIKRRMVAKLNEIVAATKNPIVNMAEFISRVEERIFEISRSHNGKEIRMIGDTVREEMQRIEDIYNHRSGSNFLTTGYPDLDNLIHGLPASESIILAARPSVGKTALALNLALNVAKMGRGVAFFSLEMSSGQLSRRSIANLSEVDSWKIDKGFLSPEDWGRLHEANADLEELPIHVDDQAQLTIHDIRGRARRIKAKGNLSLVVIDYLQIMGTDKGRSREQEIAKLSTGIKAMAKELKIPVLALAQLSRKVEDRTNKKPTMADLRESGAIEQDADMVIFLWRQNKEDLKTNLIIEKNRNGRTGIVELAFLKNISKFESVVKE